MAGPWEKYQQQAAPEKTGPWQKYAKPQAETESSGATAYDAARSFGTGLRQGAEELAGTLGDVNAAQGDIAGWIANKIGATPETQDIVRGVASKASLFPTAPTSGQIREATTSVVGDVYEPETRAGRYARKIGRFAPAAAGGPGSLIRRAATQVALPAVTSEAALEMAAGTPYEPYAEVAGGVAGAVAPHMLRRAVTPFPASQTKQKMAAILKREGVDISAGQRTGRKGLQYAESELGGAQAANLMDKQGEQFTKAALSKAGIKANRATPEVISKALDDIDDTFGGLAKRNNIKPDQQLASDIVNVVNEHRSVVPEGMRMPLVETAVRDIIKDLRTSPVITGAKYKEMRSRLGNGLRIARGGDLEALHGVRNALDDALERTLKARNSPDLAAWQQARREYRNFLAVEDAVTRAGAGAAEGLISPSALRGAVTKQGRRRYARGKGDLALLARAGESLLKPLPQSGTAPRLAVRGATGLPAVLGSLPGMAAGDIMLGAAGAAAGAAVPRTLGYALMSRPGAAYVGNQVLSNMTMQSPSQAALIAALLARPPASR